MSLFEKMKTDATMKRHLKRAKAVVPNQQSRNEDFPGEDGDYNFDWVKYREWEKDGTSYVVFEFMCTDEGEQQGFTMSIMVAFLNSAAMTVEDKMDQFFEILKTLGVDVEGTPENKLEQEVLNCASERRAIIGSVTTSKDKKYKNLRIKEYLGAGEPEAPESSEDESPDEWQKEKDAVEESEISSEETNPNVDEAPSEWEGYYGTYEGVKYWIASPDDDAKTVSLQDDDDEVIYEDVDWSLVIPSED